MPDTPPIETTALTIRDAAYILGAFITVVSIALTGAGAYWHIAGRQDLADQKITAVESGVARDLGTLKDERDKAIARRDKQVEDLQRIDVDQQQQITTIRSELGNTQIQFGKVEQKLDDTITLLRQLVDGKAQH